MKNSKYICLFVILVNLIFAQHDHNGHENMNKDTLTTKKVSENNMKHLNREGSGTSWQPEGSPVHAYMYHKDNLMLMLHGSIFLRYTASDIFKQGNIHPAKWGAPNWFMGMAELMPGKNDQLKFRLMMSLDRVTEGGEGYPLLFQSGETWKGRRLVNSQHPHDLFSELSFTYTRKFSNNFGLSVYFGYPGEPALGPVAFMHRVSAMNNPDAPLSHHWQDATHITFGVGTIGFIYKMFKAEASYFSGREPDEERFGFDKADLNSYSARLSINPGKNLSFQVSRGYLKSPEAIEADINVIRTTASVIHSYNFLTGRTINSAASWGVNSKTDGKIQHSFLMESSLQIRKTNIYGRYEFVQKDPEELDLSGFDHDSRFNLNALTIGANYRLFKFSNTDISLGIQGSIFFTPKELQYIYGSNPVSAQLYLKINPSELIERTSSKTQKH